MSADPTPQRLVIQASDAWRGVDLLEVWRYRELLYFLVWRDVKVRYKQTTLGVTWVILQPLVATLIFAFFFGRVARLPSDGIPYPLFAFAAMLPWTFFAGAVSGGALSLISSANLLTKVYFPRVLVPAAVIATAFVDFFIASALILPFLIWYRVMPPASALIWLPLAATVISLLALGLSMWLSALVVRFRDVRHVVPFILQIWMFATPIIYPLSMVPERWRALVGLNPMAGVVETFRAGLFGRPVPLDVLGWSVLAALILIVTGSIYFRRIERMLADVI